MCFLGDLFECLHLWKAARCGYECAFDGQHGHVQKSNKKWIRRYSDEENRGFMLLQRERRLKEQQDGGFVIPQNYLLDEPPKYGESLPPLTTLERQLAETRQQYWLHQQELIELETQKPRGPGVRHWEMLRRVENRQGKSIAWKEASKKCAVRGGCCGRDCQCCSKPLKEFLMPTGSRTKKSGIYGHCTVECPCCIQFRGFYKPDPACARLPELEQKGASQLPKPSDNGDGLLP